MVIVKLIGGLGNQLFQYALGKHLSIINNSKLYIDISGFEDYKLHEYSLHHFNIDSEIASTEILNDVKSSSIVSRIFKNQKISLEKNYLFKESILKKGSFNWIYLDGYWQSEKYFSPVSSAIIKNFELSSVLNDGDRAIVEYIEKYDSVVSLHVRRGDYLTNAVFNEVHGMCDLDYYLNAISYMTKELKNPMFLIFSDDIEWCKNNLFFEGNARFCDHNSADRNFADLYLMSKCHHNIIANSSFSWWGAWLNRNTNKIVIAPKTWYADKQKNAQTVDLIPKKWIRV